MLTRPWGLLAQLTGLLAMEIGSFLIAFLHNSMLKLNNVMSMVFYPGTDACLLGTWWIVLCAYLFQ